MQGCGSCPVLHLDPHYHPVPALAPGLAQSALLRTGRGSQTVTCVACRGVDTTLLPSPLPLPSLSPPCSHPARTGCVTTTPQAAAVADGLQCSHFIFLKGYFWTIFHVTPVITFRMCGCARTRCTHWTTCPLPRRAPRSLGGSRAGVVAPWVPAQPHPRGWPSPAWMRWCPRRCPLPSS
jgi:hypothetical protein